MDKKTGFKTRTIHVVFSAHLDPIWMWPWTSGMDEALATSRSACDFLDRHPETYYTQGEAWTLSMVERTEPSLFRRIRTHVENGRWEIVNGWWTQPDCNFPSEDGLRHQLGIGLEYVRDRFGVAPRCGFNPDSFGHCAKLPEILQEFGQDRYVFMRPQEHEMVLPARLFRWQSRQGGPGITTWRVAGSYMNGQAPQISREPVDSCITDLPSGCTNALVLMGVGDHGGGPTERLWKWVCDNIDLLPATRMEFSTIGRFFDAVDRDRTPLPLVVGELQRHAVGCYTVVRSCKQALRRAEHSLARAETVASGEDAVRLREAWRGVCAHQFHDTLGGSSIPEAYRFAENQLGGAAAVGDEILAFQIRRQMAALPEDPLPRIVFANPGHDGFEGWQEGVIYMEGAWLKSWGLVDSDGSDVPFQLMHSGAGISGDWLWGLRRVLVHRAIPAGGLDVLRLDRLRKPPLTAPKVRADPGYGISNQAGMKVNLGGKQVPVLEFGALNIPVVLHLVNDPSDTWAHGVSSFGEEPVAQAEWDVPVYLDDGPLMVSALQKGMLGGSRLSAEWRVYAGERWAELLLDVAWNESQTVMKLVLPYRGLGRERIDGTPGMGVVRANNGQEMPLHDWSKFEQDLAVVCPDAYALDATFARVRFTLLRSPFMALHEPCVAFARAIVSDQGTHRFRFRFHVGAPSCNVLSKEALAWHRPPLVAELTRGMPMRWTEYDVPEAL